MRCLISEHRAASSVESCTCIILNPNPHPRLPTAIFNP
jgi:hypothetical protein